MRLLVGTATRRENAGSGRGERGAAMLLTFLMMLVLSGLALAAGVFSHNSLVGSKSQLLDQQAFYLAEAGWQRARQQLIAGNWTAAASPGNTYTEDFPPAPATKVGEYRATIVDNGSNTYTITSEGYVPSQSAAVAQRQMTVSSISVTVSNGTNHSLSATASASSSNGSNTPNKANDGSTSTHWEASTKGDGEWLRMDFGGSPPTMNKVVIEEKNNINGVTIEWSDNGSSWSAPGNLSIVESPSKTWTATFTVDSRRYVRATFTASGSGKRVSVEEMESYNSSLSALGNGSATTQW